MKPISNSIFLVILLSVLVPLHSQNDANTQEITQPITQPTSQPISQARKVSNFIPSHESIILFVEDHDQKLYSLDQNALLKIQDTRVAPAQKTTDEAKEQYTSISRTRLSHAFLRFPYIISTTIDNVIEIYDIIQKSILVRTHSDGNIVRLSQDKRLLLYTLSSKIYLWNIPTQGLLRSIPFPQNKIPKHIEIASTNENIMIYYDDGTIQYRQSSTGRVLKEITESPVLESLVLNKNRRFAVGFNGSNLMSVNLLDGSITSNLLYPERIKKVVFLRDLDSVLVVSSQQSNMENVQSYKVSEDGRLEQDDLVRLSGLQDITYISYVKDKYFLFGEATGDILSYKTNTNTFNLVYTNESSAIYDAFPVDQKLFLARSDGIIHFPLSQLLGDPSKKNTVKTKTIEGTLFLLAYNDPQFYPIEPLLKTPSTTANITGNEQQSTSNEQQSKFFIVSQEKLYPLLYTFSEDLTLSTQNLQFIPSQIIRTEEDRILYYSEEDSTLVYSLQDQSRSYTFLGSRLIFSTQRTAEQSTIWLNEALHETAELLTDSTYTRLWNYDSSIINAQISPKTEQLTQQPLVFENESHLNRIDIPFNEDDIVYFEALDSPNDVFFLVVNETASQNDRENSTPSLQLPIRYPSKRLVYLLSDVTEQNSQSFFPLAITELGSVEDKTIVEIATLGKQQETLLIFTSQNILRFQINLETMNLQLKSSFLYPKDLGVPLKIRVFENYIFYVDRNNVVSTLQIESDKIVKISSLLLTENEATVVYY